AGKMLFHPGRRVATGGERDRGSAHERRPPHPAEHKALERCGGGKGDSRGCFGRRTAPPGRRARQARWNRAVCGPEGRRAGVTVRFRSRKLDAPVLSAQITRTVYVPASANLCFRPNGFRPGLVAAGVEPSPQSTVSVSFLSPSASER